MRKTCILLVLVAVAAGAAVPAGARTTASATFTFVSFGEDRVGVGSSTQPGSGPDGHFRLVVDAPGETLSAIEFSSANADGSLCCGAHWDTVPRGWWVLGVLRSGTMLNAGDVGLSDPIAGTATYELYAQNTGLFKDGRSFRVDVRFASGTAIATVMTIGTPGSRPVAPIKPSDPTAPANPTPGPTPPAPPVPPAPRAPTAKPAVALTASLTRTRVRGCVFLRTRTTAKPAGSKVVLERRAGSAWAILRSAKTCSAKPARVVYRATLKSGSKVLARSKPLTITWTT